MDLIYQVLKQAGEISNSKSRVNLEQPTPPVGITVDRGAAAAAAGASSAPGSSSSSGQSLNRRTCPPPTQTARAQSSNLAVVNPAPCSTSSGWFPGEPEECVGRRFVWEVAGDDVS